MSNPHVVKPGSKVRLADHDPRDSTLAKSEKDADRRLAKLRDELQSLQGLLYAADKYALLIVLQGMDASGKDGTIRHVLSGLSPIGVHVTGFKAPSGDELEHDYLWRVHQVMPRRGEIAIFNRSHYEDVLVVRVRKLVPKAVWKPRYRQINDFERMLVENGTVILKFFLHISREEQKERFEERLQSPRKFWKFRLGDLDDRKLWDEYQEAYEDAMAKTSTAWAPWTIVPADRKWYRDLVVAERVVETLKGLEMEYPPLDFDPKSITIE
jgi:PPK2 family polyphosphate:nucleotide phosphotransferase